MTRTRRLIVGVVVYFFTYLLLALNGAGLWAMCILPYGMYEFWDGMVTGREIWVNES